MSESLQLWLVEDDDGHASLIHRNLTRAGITNEVIRLRDGQELIDRLFAQGDYADTKIDTPLLILLDIHMPRLDGYEVLKQLKANEATAIIPIIILTTTDDPREVERCYQLGCSIYVTKPVQYEEFAEAIKRLGLMIQIVKAPPYRK